jgi:hypothetical protein
MRAKLTDLLSRLLVTHSPSGDEDETEALLRELLAGRRAGMENCARLLLAYAVEGDG